MKTKIIFLLLFIGFLNLTSSLKAQDCEILIDPYAPPSLMYEPTGNESYLESLCINIFFHIVRDDNGNGGISSNEIPNIVKHLNKAYGRFDISFVNLGYDYIDKSIFLHLKDNTERDFNYLSQINRIPNAVNYYIVKSSQDSKGRSLAGSAYFGSNGLNVVGNAVYKATSPHEVAHCLNLYHTLETGLCEELLDGSNCKECGDRVCDTPADVDPRDYQDNIIPAEYHPDLGNFMSYHHCLYPPIERDHFTNGQALRMKISISNSLLSGLISRNCMPPEIIGKEIICTDESIVYTLENGADNIKWNVSSNLEILSYDDLSIRVKPINYTVNDYAFIEAANLTQKVKKDIWIGKPKISLTYQPQGSNYVYLYMTGSTVDINKQKILSTNWREVSRTGCFASFSGNGFSGMAHGGCSSWVINGEVSATNACGTTTLYPYITPPAPDPGPGGPCRNYYEIAQASENIYELRYIIIPCSRQLSDTHFDTLGNAKNTIIMVYDMYGNKLMETKNKSVYISDLRPGAYIIHALVEDRLLNYKFIKK